MDQVLQIALKKIRKANRDDVTTGRTIQPAGHDQRFVTSMVKGLLRKAGLLSLIRPIPLSIIISRTMKEYRQDAYRSQKERLQSAMFFAEFEITKILPMYKREPRKQYRKNEKLASQNYETRCAETQALRSKFRSQANQQRNEATRLRTLASKMSQRGQFDMSAKYHRQAEQCDRLAQELQSKGDISRIETALALPMKQATAAGTQPIDTGKYTSLVAMPTDATVQQCSAINAYCVSIGADVVIRDNGTFVHVPRSYSTHAVKVAIDSIMGKQAKKKKAKTTVDSQSLSFRVERPKYEQKPTCEHKHIGEWMCFDCGAPRFVSCTDEHVHEKENPVAGDMNAEQKNLERLRRKMKIKPSITEADMEEIRKGRAPYIHIVPQVTQVEMDRIKKEVVNMTPATRFVTE